MIKSLGRKDMMKYVCNFITGKDDRFLIACSKWVFPLTFTFSYLLNFAFYYLGLAFAENAVRKYGFMLGCVLFACVCVWVFFHTVKRQRIGVARWVLLGLVVAFFGISFVLGLLTDSSRGVMLDNAVSCAFFVFPAFLAGIVAAIKKTGDSFFCSLEKLSFFALPGAAIYMVFALFNCNPSSVRGLGILHYMTIAYTLMPLFFALLVRFSDKEDLPIPFTNRFFKHPQLVRGIMIAVYWIALIATATRGMYVCVAFFCLLFVISRWIRRGPNKRAWWLSVALAALLLFNMFVYAPAGMQAVSRMTGFVQNLMDGEFSTAEDGRDDMSDIIDDLVHAEGGEQIANRPSEPSNPSEPPDPNENKPESTIKIRDRGTLYKLALGEFIKSPLFGMGPGGYTVKYGMYPHNILLEAMCETGSVGSLFLFALILIAGIKLCIVGWHDKNVWYIMLFLLTYFLQANISGALWNCPPLLCALGYGLAMPLPKRVNKLKAR